MKSFVKMSNEDYHQHPAIGSTTLKLAFESMAKFKAQVDGRIPRKETDYFNLGSAAHAAVLEQDFSQYTCGPDENKSTKKWKDFEAANPSRICLKPAQYDVVRGMHHAFYSHPIAPKIVNRGYAENTFMLEILGTEYKARPDWITPEENSRDEVESHYICDYKTCESLDFESVQRAIALYGYDLSAMHYINIVSQCTEKPITEYYWIFQEKEAPFEIGVFRMDDECKDRARKIVNGLYAKISTALRDNVWPEKFKPEIIDIDIPHYLVHKRSV